MYKIIGGDQKEYGMVTPDQMRRWIADGRVNGQTPVLAEGATEWRPLATFPEFAEALGLMQSAVGAPPPESGPPGLAPEVFTRDYDLDIGRCIGDAWAFLKANFGLIFGGVAVYLLIQGALSLLGQIPLLGLVFTIGSMVIAGPLTGGLYYFLLKNIRHQPADIGEVFSGFRLAFGQLVLGYVVPALLTGLAALPGLALMAYPLYMIVSHHAAEPPQILLAGLGLIVAGIPATYFSVSWLFALPLIIDKQLAFWPAMAASRKMVGKHWWLVFGLVVVCGLINVAGLVACCVGIFVTVPIAFGALMYAYESIFSASAAASA